MSILGYYWNLEEEENRMTPDEVLAQVEKIDKRIEERLEDIWDSIDKLRDRLPNWAVFYISFLSAIAASAVTLLFKE